MNTARTTSKLTPKPALTASALYETQNKVLHKLFELHGLPYNSNKVLWMSRATKLLGRTPKGLSNMTLGERRLFIGSFGKKQAFNPFVPRDLAEWQKGDANKQSATKPKTPKAKGYPGRPQNMDKDDSRSKQLGKIEAYLAEAKRPWEYADALAKRLCGVDKVEWVPTELLYRIITALKKDAERHGRESL